MKSLFLLTPVVRLCLLGTCLYAMAGCATKSAPLLPSQLYSNAGTSRVGGAMRLESDKPVPRNPPRLPAGVKDSSLASDVGGVKPPPPPTLSSSAIPKVVSPVPGEADGYFSEVPAPFSALGGLFNSLFIPPAPPAPPAPTVISTATYREVK
jgi:hypothetical protein